jgi:hypothetical protein
MSAVTEGFIDDLVAQVPSLQPLLRQHLEDNFGEVLPHVFLGDLTRHVVQEYRKAHDGEANVGVEAGTPLENVLKAFEDIFAAGNTEISELIVVSFLENLPRPGRKAQTFESSSDLGSNRNCQPDRRLFTSHHRRK